MVQVYLKDFSLYPGPRFRTLGPDSGEKFREEVLVGALKDGSPVTVILDGVLSAPGSSFLDEAFAGLVRNGEDPKVVESITIISNEDPPLVQEVRDYIQEAIEAL